MASKDKSPKSPARGYSPLTPVFPAAAPAFSCHVPNTARRTGMLADICETPKVMTRLLEENMKATGNNTKQINIPSLHVPMKAGHHFAGKSALEVMAACLTPDRSFHNKITVIGCGTSYHAALLAEYLIEHIARVPVEVAYASEYRYKSLLHREGDVLIAISSSGETMDTLESLRALKRSMGEKVLTIAVVNEADSTIARESDCCLDVMSGEELGITSTKVFSSSALALVLLAMAVGEMCSTMPKDDFEKLLADVCELPSKVQMVLDSEASSYWSKANSHEESSGFYTPMMGECRMWDISCQNVLANNFIFLGRGFNFPIAMEGAMKTKEVAYIHAEGYPAAEMKHGPIALIDQFMPVVVICPRADPSYEKIKANLEEVQTRNGAVIVITEDSNQELEEICEHVIKVPQTHEFLMPLIAVIPMQLLAFMMGILRGNEVDHPRGLVKTV